MYRQCPRLAVVCFRRRSGRSTLCGMDEVFYVQWLEPSMYGDLPWTSRVPTETLEIAVNYMTRLRDEHPQYREWRIFKGGDPDDLDSGTQVYPDPSEV